MIIPSPAKKNHGVVLLICLGVAVVITVAFGTYMYTIMGENQAVARAQGWNSSMVLAEAGIEEGLSLVNKLVGVSTTTSQWVNTATADGWTQSGNVYSLQRSLGNGYYNVWVTNVSSSTVCIKSTGTYIFTNRSVQNLQRSVVVTAATHGTYMGALISKGLINLSGGALFDSYNSSQGPYNILTHHANASVMSLTNIANSITMSGGDIYGHVYTAAAGSIKQSGSAAIGNTNYAGPGIEAGWSANTANVVIPDAPALPSASWLGMPSPVNIGSTNYYILNGSGPGTITYYQIPASFNGMSGSAQMIITNGTVYLDIEGSFQMSGSSAMVVKSGSTLTGWFNGSSPQVSGSGVVNATGSSANVTFYGTTNCTSLQYSGSSALVGSIYAPYAALSWSGSAALYGAVVAASYVNSGGSALHYDESLGLQNNGEYMSQSWQEVTP